MPTHDRETGFPEPGHNHEACRDDIVARARTAFDERGLKLTELRERVFAEIASSHHAIGAYDVIDRLAKTGTRLAPVSVYRAIDALLEAGVVHRLESRNAFFACHTSHAGNRQHVVLACADCGTIAEIPAQAVFDGIDEIAARNLFAPHARMVEVTGRCSHCSSAVGDVGIAPGVEVP